MLRIREVYRDTEKGSAILKAIFDLRLEVYSSLGWVVSPSERSKMIKDEFDDIPETTHFAILEEGRVVGSHRMTRFSAKHKLPLIKDGIDIGIFGRKRIYTFSEATRLLLKQDRKYPGCAMQMSFNTLNYELSNNSDYICTIGNPDHADFFEFLGAKPAAQDIDVVLDTNAVQQVVVKGIPMLVTRESLNRNLDLSKYEIDRDFVVVKSV